MKSLVLATALVAFASPLANAQAFDADEETRIRELVIETLLENPEILLEVSDRLQEKQFEEEQARAREAIPAVRDELFADPNAPVVGNPEGDVTIVEFMDYNCGFCKQANPEVAALLEQDANVRVVYREWPILGDDSVAAARLALAAREQDAYEAMHRALMAEPQVDEEIALLIAQDLGLDVEKLQRDAASLKVEAHLLQSRALADAIGVSGTPAFVIGDQYIGGAATTDELAAAVRAAREAPGE